MSAADHAKFAELRKDREVVSASESITAVRLSDAVTDEHKNKWLAVRLDDNTEVIGRLRALETGRLLLELMGKEYRHVQHHRIVEVAVRRYISWGGVKAGAIIGNIIGINVLFSLMRRYESWFAADLSRFLVTVAVLLASMLVGGLIGSTIGATRKPWRILYLRRAPDPNRPAR